MVILVGMGFAVGCAQGVGHWFLLLRPGTVLGRLQRARAEIRSGGGYASLDFHFEARARARGRVAGEPVLRSS
jgi:hypothetical protein